MKIKALILSQAYFEAKNLRRRLIEKKLSIYHTDCLIWKPENVHYEVEFWEMLRGQSFHDHFRGTSIVYLVYDLTNRPSFDLVSKHLIELEKRYYKGISLCLIGTEADIVQGDEKKRAVSQDEALKLAENYGIPFFEVSAKTGMGVQAAFLAALPKQAQVSHSLYDIELIPARNSFWSRASSEKKVLTPEEALKVAVSKFEKNRNKKLSVLLPIIEELVTTSDSLVSKISYEVSDLNVEVEVLRDQVQSEREKAIKMRSIKEKYKGIIKAQAKRALEIANFILEVVSPLDGTDQKLGEHVKLIQVKARQIFDNANKIKLTYDLTGETLAKEERKFSENKGSVVEKMPVAEVGRVPEKVAYNISELEKQLAKQAEIAGIETMLKFSDSSSYNSESVASDSSLPPYNNGDAVNQGSPREMIQSHAAHQPPPQYSSSSSSSSVMGGVGFFESSAKSGSREEDSEPEDKPIGPGM